MAAIVTSDLRTRLSVPRKILSNCIGVKPSSNPPKPPASSRLVPVADAQLKTKMAGSAVGLATTGGVRETALCSTGTVMLRNEMPLRKFGFPAGPPFKNVFTGVSPHTKTNSDNRIHGIQA